MNIGFDAKRAYHNGTGLGHYSRTLIRSLAEYFPQDEYFLFNPKPSKLFKLNGKNIHEVLPSKLLHKTLSSVWRSTWIKSDLEKLNIDIYHGLSNEIPLDIDVTDIRSVVTIHDVIFERFPAQYSTIDVEIYKRQFKYACDHADKVIAISEQTKEDIMEFYKTPEEKISVCYQSCNPAFGEIVSEKIKQQIKDFIKQNGLDKQIIFLSEDPLAKVASSFLKAEDFPAIYQSAIAMIYPSFFEGFGIPVLEALWSRLPVITSNVSCLPEAGGDGAYYVDPNSSEEIAEGMKTIFADGSFTEALKEKGWQHAQNFTQQKCAADVMRVYESLKVESVQ